jgi:aldose 1-epimerase
MRPSGENVELVHGDQRAVVVEVGGGLRTYAVGDRQVLDGYAEDGMCTSARGQVLVPWPNRIEDGAYELDGERFELPIDDRGTGCAIHGLVRWASWRAADRSGAAVTMEHELHARPGYPFALEIRVRYALGDGGLTVATSVRNVGDRACPFGAGHHPYLLPHAGRADDAVVRIPAASLRRLGERSLPGLPEPASGDLDLRDARRLGGTVLDTTYGDLVRDADGFARVRVDDLELRVDAAWAYLQVFTGDPLPDVARRSIAVEPMTCPPNAFRSGDGLRLLAPGETFAGTWGISVVAA